MAYEREQAIGQFVVKKKQVYEIGIRSQALVQEIHNETNFFEDVERDFLNIDFKKIRALASELIKQQEDFKKLSAEMVKLKETYNIEE